MNRFNRNIEYDQSKVFNMSDILLEKKTKPHRTKSRSK